ncbi:endonuclease/exonuclease/phosphatase family protein [Flavobacterium algicola]|uniref:endonuclease/exonuclease/phosphatase family protein n=1 Tax=Flavobacterium algicola TaxID=556529 RepID=UPI001EFC9F32|nr:endonuclease/exonuclease/phosphatase family protein [Flavobacterium algicola]MCG9794041.1 endonuclease/exonuclease/phosphatase family protein [Flavobacterium algicola]
MKKYIFLLMAITTFTNGISQNYKMMTYNLRLDVTSDGENAWKNRKDFLSKQVLFFAPDIMGVQEAKPNQMEDLKKSLTNYAAIGLGRDGDQKGEHSSIFYNTKKFKVEQVNTFWLSPTPDKVSMGWDAAYPRICTYALFTDIEKHTKIWFFNTHLDHIGPLAQLNGMKQIEQKIAEVNTKKYPVILTGDFNVEPDSELIKELSQIMVNTQSAAQLTFGPSGSFNGFKFNEPVTRKIDYIFTSNSKKIKVHKYAVLSESIDLKYPSDHFPIYVDLSIDK